MGWTVTSQFLGEAIAAAIAAPAYDPATDPSVKLLLMADQGFTGAGATAAWADQSPSGFDATAAVLATGLVLTAAQQNGLPMVMFNGLTDGMLAAGAAAVLTGTDVPFTWMLVFKRAGPPIARYECLLSAQQSANSNPFQYLEFSPHLPGPDDATLYIEREDDSGTFGDNETLPNITDEIAHVVFLSFDGVTPTVYLDGSNVGSGYNLFGGPPFGPVTLDTYGIGYIPGTTAAPGDAEWCHTYLGDHILWDRGLSPAEVAVVQSWAQARWATP
jgi:hypothetical protein